MPPSTPPRIGAAVGPTFLYVKGGAAWVRDEYTDVATCSGTQRVFRAGIYANCDSLYVGQETRDGRTVGAACGFRISPNWSLKAEYNHMDFGKKSVWLVDEEGDKFSEEDSPARGHRQGRLQLLLRCAGGACRVAADRRLCEGRRCPA